MNNPLGVLPKKDRGFRLIFKFVNEHIGSLCSVSYASFDQDISMIQENDIGLFALQDGFV